MGIFSKLFGKSKVEEEVYVDGGVINTAKVEPQINTTKYDNTSIISEIDNCENMSDVQEVTPVVKQYVQGKDFNTKQQVLNHLSDKTFDVFKVEYENNKPVVKEKTTKKPAAKKTTKKTTAKKTTTRRKKAKA